MSPIPAQLEDYPLIRVCRPRCQSHTECRDAGKRPVSSTQDPEPLSKIRNWVRAGGNYGVVPKAKNSLVVLDSDSELFSRVVDEKLPPTFTVKTGSGNRHYYYRSGYAQNESVKIKSEEFGSVRSNNWHTVGPGSVHPDTGQEYTVEKTGALRWIPESDIAQFLRTLRTEVSREDGGGGGPAAAAPSSRQDRTQKASDLQIQPTQETLRTLQFINSQQKRTEIAQDLDHDHPPRQTRVWAGGFLYSAVGLTQQQIERLLKETADWATDSGRIRVEVRSLIESSIKNQKAQESVSLDRYLNGDMAGRTAESRKMEESGGGRTLSGGENMDYTSKDTLTTYNADSAEKAEDGERVVRVELTNMKGRDENGETDVDFVTVQKGTLRDNGEFGVSPEFNGDSKSVGAADPDDLRLIAQGLTEMASRIED